MFCSPLLNALDKMAFDEESSFLDAVINRMAENGMGIRGIAITIGVSAIIVSERLSKETRSLLSERKRELKEREIEEIRKRSDEGKAPKEIAYDMQIPIHKVYKVLKGYKDGISRNSKNEESSSFNE